MSRKNWTNDKLFSRLLTNKTERTYWDNLSELRRRPTEEVYEKASAFAHSEVAKEKNIGIDVLAQLGHNPRFKQTESLDLFFELLEANQPDDVLSSILFAIGHNNESLTKERVLKLTTFRNHQSGDVRQAVVNSLLGIEQDHAINALIDLTQDPIASIRDWATFGIGSQIETNNKEILKALWNRRNDTSNDTKLEAIVGLAVRQDFRTKDLIIKELQKGEHGSLLFEAITALEDKSLIPHMEEVLKQTDEQEGEWIKALKGAIESLGKTNA